MRRLGRLRLPVDAVRALLDQRQREPPAVLLVRDGPDPAARLAWTKGATGSDRLTAEFRVTVIHGSQRPIIATGALNAIALDVFLPGHQGHRQLGQLHCHPTSGQSFVLELSTSGSIDSLSLTPTGPGTYMAGTTGKPSVGPLVDSVARPFCNASAGRTTPTVSSNPAGVAYPANSCRPSAGSPLRLSETVKSPLRSTAATPLTSSGPGLAAVMAAAQAGADAAVRAVAEGTVRTVAEAAVRPVAQAALPATTSRGAAAAAAADGVPGAWTRYTRPARLSSRSSRTRPLWPTDST